MKTEPLIGEDLARMQKTKAEICISIIVPTHRQSPDRRVDEPEVKKAIQKAKEYLLFKYQEEKIKPLLLSLDDLYGQIDFNRNPEGIGLFVSEGFQKLVRFFFPVKEKVMVSDYFETRDLLLQTYFSKPYLVLMLDEKEARLFQGQVNELEELKDVHFPMKYEDNYEYSHPVRGSSYTGHAFIKDFERDKTQLEEMRYESFLEMVDETLNSYLVQQNPLILAGPKKDLAYFREITNHGRHIAGSLTGNYSYMPVSELANLCWESVQAFLDKERNEKLNVFRERIGEGRGLTGIVNTWKAAKQGRALSLLVEKDFSLPGFLLKEDEYNLYLHPPGQPHRILPDAVNALMDVVVEMGGEVILVDNEALTDYERIALITRF